MHKIKDKLLGLLSLLGELLASESNLALPSPAKALLVLGLRFMLTNQHTGTHRKMPVTESPLHIQCDCFSSWTVRFNSHDSRKDEEAQSIEK